MSYPCPIREEEMLLIRPMDELTIEHHEWAAGGLRTVQHFVSLFQFVLALSHPELQGTAEVPLERMRMIFQHPLKELPVKNRTIL